MRRVALLLAFVLLTPLASGALCGVTCDGAHARAAHQSADQGCPLHRHEARTHALRSANQPVCHQTAEGPRAASVTPLQQSPAAATSRTSAIDPPSARHGAATVPPEIRPPDILRTGAQLRI